MPSQAKKPEIHYCGPCKLTQRHYPLSHGLCCGQCGTPKHQNGSCLIFATVPPRAQRVQVVNA